MKNQATPTSHAELVDRLIARPESYIEQSYTDIFSLAEDERHRF